MMKKRRRELAAWFGLELDDIVITVRRCPHLGRPVWRAHHGDRLLAYGPA